MIVIEVLLSFRSTFIEWDVSIGNLVATDTKSGENWAHPSTVKITATGFVSSSSRSKCTFLISNFLVILRKI